MQYESYGSDGIMLSINKFCFPFLSFYTFEP